MRWLLSLILLGLLGAVQAVSSSGNKLLVVLEELAEKSKYSKYFEDLEGMGFNYIASSLIDTDDFCLQSEASNSHSNRQRTRN